MENNLTLGEKLRNFRKRAGLSQFDLEIKIDASPGSLSRIESGQINPTKETLIKIAQALSISSYDVQILFGLDPISNLEPVLNSNYEVFKNLDLDSVLQSSVDNIVKELNLFSCFIVLVENNRIVAQTSTSNWSSRLTEKVLKRKIKGLSTELSPSSPNLMVQCILQDKPILDKDVYKFVYPAISLNLAKLLQRITGAKFCIAFPVQFDNKVIGAIMFGKSEEVDFVKEMDSLREFCKHIALAINNARQYEKLKKELENLKSK